MLKTKASMPKAKAKAIPRAGPRRNIPASSSGDSTRAATSEPPSQTPVPTPTTLDRESSQPPPPASTTVPFAELPTPNPTQYFDEPPALQSSVTERRTANPGGTGEKESTVQEAGLAIASRETSQSASEVISTPQSPSRTPAPIKIPDTTASTVLVDPAPSRQCQDSGAEAQPTEGVDSPAEPAEVTPAPIPSDVPTANSHSPSTHAAASRSTSSANLEIVKTRSVQRVTPSADNGPTSQTQPSTEITAGSAAVTSPSGRRTRRRRETGSAGEAADQDGESGPPKKRPRAKRAAPLPGEEGYQPAKPRLARKSRATADTEGTGEDWGESGSAQPNKGPSRQREATPEDAETVEIDPTQVKMADLTKDMHIGKKFSLHDELMERERAKRQKYYDKKRLEKIGRGEDGEEQDANASAPKETDSAAATPSGNTTEGDEEPSGRTGNQLAPVGETYRIVDGMIVVDASSLQVDRHARAAEEAGELEEHEENDFTNHTTSATYLRRNLKPQQWTDEETEKFYYALSCFGTDFDTISRMFQGKQRKHIKLKFNREERANKARIDAALVGKKTVSIDMDEYKRHTGQVYETAEAIYAEQKKAEEEFEAHQKAIEEEKAEEARKKREALFGAPGEGADGADGEGGGGKKKRGRGRKKAAPQVSIF